MGSFYTSYKWRLVVSITASLFLILLIINTLTYSMIKGATERQLGLGAQGTAVGISLWISDNIESYRAFVAKRDVNSRYYRHMQNSFARIKEQNNIRFIYTINRIDEKRTEVILDSEPLGSKDYSPPGELEKTNDVSLKVFNTKQPVILPPTNTPYGVLLGSCAPIFDEKGMVIGAVGIDIESSAVFSILKNWFVTLIGISFLLLGLIGFLLSKVSGFFLDPLLKDKLTGAYSKRYSETLLQRCIDGALKGNQDLSVMMLDLDHFKKVNDTYGHLFGDIVLAKTSNTIQSCLRKDDFLIRYGGEEFLVLLFSLGTDLAAAVAERIRKRIEAAEIYNEKEERSVNITISIGLTGLQNKRLSGQELINNADKALYKAKETRNAIAIV